VFSVQMICFTASSVSEIYGT